MSSHLAIAACALLLAIIFAAPVAIVRKGPSCVTDKFGPVSVCAGLHLISVVPYLLLIAINPEAVSPLIRNHPEVGDLDTAVIRYAIIQALAYTLLVTGIVMRFPKALVRRLPVVGEARSGKRVYVAAWACFLCGFGSYLILLNQIGGAEYLIENLHRRGRLAQGFGYLSNLVPLVSFGVLLLLYSFKYRRSTAKLVLILFAGAIAVAALSSFGGRKQTLHLLVFSVLVWNYGISPIRRLAPKAVMISLFAVPYFLAMPLIRSEGGIQRYLRDPSSLAADIVSNVEGVVSGLSYVDTYLFVTSYFDPNNLWWGRAYGDLLQAPIPSRFLQDKPPIDDGMYVRTLAGGKAVEPPASRHDLYPSSWPPETLGTMYMNFWLPGVLLGMVLLGRVYRFAYEYMLSSGYTMFSILCYGFIILNFHLSNLRIVQTAVRVALLLALFSLFFGVRAARAHFRGNAASPRLPFARLEPSGEGHHRIAP